MVASLELTGSLGGTVGSRGSSAVGTVGGHAGGHHDGALDSKLNELSGGNLGAEVGTEDLILLAQSFHGLVGSAHIKVEQLLELGALELQSGLVLGHAGIGDHAVNTTGLLHNLVDGLLDALFGCDIGLDELEVGEALLQRSEVLAGLHQIQRVDILG